MQKLMPAVVLLHQLGLLAQDVVSKVHKIIGRSYLLLLQVLDGVSDLLDQFLHLIHHIRNDLICKLFVGLLLIAIVVIL